MRWARNKLPASKESVSELPGRAVRSPGPGAEEQTQGARSELRHSQEKSFSYHPILPLFQSLTGNACFQLSYAERLLVLGLGLNAVVSKYVCVSPSFSYSLELLKQAESDFYFGLGAQKISRLHVLVNLPEDSCSEYHSTVYF